MEVGCSGELPGMCLSLDYQEINFCCINHENMGAVCYHSRTYLVLTHKYEVGSRRFTFSVTKVHGPHFEKHSFKLTLPIFYSWSFSKQEATEFKCSLIILLESHYRPASLLFLSDHFHAHFGCLRKQVYMVSLFTQLLVFW